MFFARNSYVLLPQSGVARTRSLAFATGCSDRAVELVEGLIADQLAQLRFVDGHGDFLAQAADAAALIEIAHSIERMRRSRRIGNIEIPNDDRSAFRVVGRRQPSAIVAECHP